MRGLAETTPPEPAATTSPAKKTRIVFIDIGRALGALLVFYSHLAHEWVETKGEKAPYVDFLEALSSDPMHMAKQGIGEVAVPFFFLVSGFVVTPIALRQGTRRFSVNRLIRVYVPIVFVVLLTVGALLVHLHPPSTGQSQELTPLTVLTNSLLANYLITPQVVLLPVAWSMIVEVMFYAVLLAILPVLRRSVWLAIAIELTFIFVVLMSARQFSASYFLFAVNVSYLPIPILGQIVWATTSKRIPLWAGGVFGGVTWALYVLGDIINVGRIDSSYNLALAFAVLCFLMGMFAEPKLRQRRFWTSLSERSYSIYLLHSLVAFVLLDLMRPAVPFPIALVLAIAAVFGVVELSYRYVERPSHTLAQRLSHGTQAKPKPIPISSEITIELPRVEPKRRPRPRPPQQPKPPEARQANPEPRPQARQAKPEPQPQARRSNPEPRPNPAEETALMRPVRRQPPGRHAAPRRVTPNR